jgi:hypothetical protein
VRVGFNYPYPWNAYGVYLGSGNPWGSNSALDGWPEQLRDNLARLRDLGVSVVRVFLLGNAANYGRVGANGFVPPARLDDRVLDQLGRMFESFKATELRVIPSLLDFKALGRRRAGVENGCGERTAIARSPALRAAFVDQVLRPFLNASLPYRAQIHAWEVMNEPVWNVLPFVPPHIAGGRSIGLFGLREFLRELLDVIQQPPFGFPSTVGHRFARDLLYFPTGTRPQFHFYPAKFRGLYVSDRTLPHASETHAFIGELGSLGCDPQGRYRHGQPFRELGGQDDADEASRVRSRLSLARDKGYELSLLWPDVLREPAVGAPDVLKLTPGAQRGIAEFCRHHA